MGPTSTLTSSGSTGGCDAVGETAQLPDIAVQAIRSALILIALDAEVDPPGSASDCGRPHR